MKGTDDGLENGQGGLTRRTLLKTSAAGAAVAGIGGTAVHAGSTTAESRSAEDTAYGNCWQCHKLCGMEVTLNDDGRAEEVHGIDGHPRGSAGAGTKGTLCPKGLSQLEKAYSPQRIKAPYVRKDGDLTQVDWAEAFAYTARRLEEFAQAHGPEKLLRQKGWGTAGIFDIFFGDLYGSPTTFSHPVPVCFGSMATTGTVMGLGGGNIRWVDYPNTEYVLVWGRDPLETFAGQWEAKQLLAARDRGATIVTIDPVYSETAKKSDLWLPIEPRTDGALALAMANVIIEEGLYDEAFVENWTYGFEAYTEAVEGKTPEWAAEITGLDAGDIRDVATGFARAAPRAGINSWTGLGQNADHQKAAQNVVALTGLLGTIDRPGGQRWFGGPNLADPFEVRDIDLPNNAAERTNVMTDPENDYASLTGHAIATAVPWAVENDDIAGLVYYYRNNPKDGASREWFEALDAMDLVIGIDAFWSETARRADVVLPESSQLEKAMLGTGGYGAYNTRGWVTGSGAAVDPQWDTKPGFDIIAELAAEMGYGEYFPWAHKTAFLNDQLSALDLTLADLEAEDTYVLAGEFGYEKWKDGTFSNGTNQFWFDVEKAWGDLYERLSEQVGTEIDTAPQWVPPGTIGEARTEAYPLEHADARSVEFSHSGDQALSLPLEQHAESVDLEHENYRGNYVLMHTADADARGVEHGDMVRVESRHGAVELMAFVTEGIVPGMVSVEPYGFGDGSIQPDEEGANNMKLHSPDQIDPVSGTIDRHFAVEVTKIGGEH